MLHKLLASSRAITAWPVIQYLAQPVCYEICNQQLCALWMLALIQHILGGTGKQRLICCQAAQASVSMLLHFPANFIWSMVSASLQVPESLWHEMQQRRMLQGKNVTAITTSEDDAILGIDALYEEDLGRPAAFLRQKKSYRCMDCLRTLRLNKLPSQSHCCAASLTSVPILLLVRLTVRRPCPCRKQGMVGSVSSLEVYLLCQKAELP